MKKLFEGATVIGAVILLFCTIGFFLFNINSQNQKSKITEKSENKIEKIEKSHNILNLKNQETLKKQSEEIEYYKKMNDPLWNYYDRDSERYKPYPGPYHHKNPPPSSESLKSPPNCSDLGTLVVPGLLVSGESELPWEDYAGILPLR